MTTHTQINTFIMHGPDTFRPLSYLPHAQVHICLEPPLGTTITTVSLPPDWVNCVVAPFHRPWDNTFPHTHVIMYIYATLIYVSFVCSPPIFVYTLFYMTIFMIPLIKAKSNHYFLCLKRLTIFPRDGDVQRRSIV